MCLGMYIGLILKEGFYYFVWEIVDNLIDEVLVGFVGYIKVYIELDNFIIVVDDGCGILVDI